MIVYQELSSLVKDLGFSGRALYGASYSRSNHYHPIRLPKANGEYRELYAPDAFLKSIQRRILGKLLVYEPVSPYATAYRFGGGTLANASPHTGRPVLMKMDIRRFFDHILYPQVKEKAFPAWRYSESNRILLTMLCTYRDALPQGAPTSPAISNLVMVDFDNTLGAWCGSRDIVYTRYCDDMTFSGDFSPGEVEEMVKTQLAKLGFFVNRGKTRVIRNGQRKSITGIVVNQKPNVPPEYRRQLRQACYYCRKFGIRDHMARAGVELSEEQYLRHLLGRVQYVLQVTPDDPEMLRYQTWLLEQLRHL